MRRADKTLLEQMQISDVEILQRMELLGLNKETLDLLSRQQHIIDNNVDLIVDEFYERQTAIDQITLLIGDADTLQRLHSAQRKYVVDLFAGRYDSEYVNNRLRIGMVHKRIGVDPKLYLSAVLTLKTLIVGVFQSKIKNNKQLNEIISALEKLFYFDITLVFDTYIDSLLEEIETAKRHTEEYAASLEEKVAERTRQLEELTKIDPLTLVYNRREMQDVLQRELLLAKRRLSTLSIIYFDIDNFKEINDSYGHLKGDEILQFIGHVAMSSIRETDVPCRFGGDEFCLILPDCSCDKAYEISQTIAERFIMQYPDFSLSIGIADTGPKIFLSDDDLIKKADKMMYKAKLVEGTQICA